MCFFKKENKLSTHIYVYISITREKNAKGYTHRKGVFGSAERLFSFYM